MNVYPKTSALAGFSLLSLVLLTGCNAGLIQAAGSGLAAGLLNPPSAPGRDYDLKVANDRQQRLKGMNDKQICHAAVSGDSVAWDPNPLISGAVEEAKRRGYSASMCDEISGFKNAREVAQRQASLEAEHKRLRKLNDKQICQRAVTVDSGTWEPNPNPFISASVAEAKRRGFSSSICDQLSGFKDARESAKRRERLRAEHLRAGLEAEVQEKQRAEAARRAEEERLRILAAREAERIRKAAEAARRAEEERQRQEAARRAEEERKRLEAERLAEAQPVNVGTGSGFAINNEGYFLTNHHVIKGCQLVIVHPPSGIQKSKVIASDIKNDLALLKTSLSNEDVLPLSRENASLLDDVVVAGFPFSRVLSSSVKVTKGVVSSLAGFGDDYSLIQIDAAIQPGNSGGPILNEMGNVIGVAVSKLSKKRFVEAENTNFGIKSSTAKAFVEANNVELPEPNSRSLQKNELANLITKTTHLISCWVPRSVARKMRENSGRKSVEVSPTMQQQVEQLD